MLFESTEAGWEEKPKDRQVLKTEVSSGSQVRNNVGGQHKEGVMRSYRLVLLAMLFALPFTVIAKAQVDVGVGVGLLVLGVDGQPVGEIEERTVRVDFFR